MNSSLLAVGRARVPGLLVTIFAGCLISCGDPPDTNASHAKEFREAELKKEHRKEIRQMYERIAALEETNSLLAAQVGEARLEKVTALTKPTRIRANAEEDETSPEIRKIASYRQNGLSGVPGPVAAEILRKAGRESRSWLALEDIEAEGAGYRAVQAFAASQTKMLREDRDELVNAAKREHPDDWSEMARFIDRQVDAWTILQRWKAEGVPGLETWESEAVLCGATEKFPFDWACALGSIAEASRGQIAGRGKTRENRKY
jgi:hypothetical protein